jgi:hypothetical protein
MEHVTDSFTFVEAEQITGAIRPQNFFGRWTVRISTGTPAIVAYIIRSSTQSFQDRIWLYIFFIEHNFNPRDPGILEISL